VKCELDYSVYEHDLKASFREYGDETMVSIAAEKLSVIHSKINSQ
jgi:hypothetical protein